MAIAVSVGVTFAQKRHNKTMHAEQRAASVEVETSLAAAR
jgi:hypothetical protein